MNGELKLSVICLLEEVLRDPDLLPQERKATANILRYTTERSRAKQEDTVSESWTDLHFKALLSLFFIIISYFFPPLVYSGCSPSTSVMSYPTLPHLNYSPLLQCPFSRWAGRRPAEDRGHPADGKQHLRSHSLKMLIFCLPRHPLIKHSPQLFVHVAVFFSWSCLYMCVFVCAQADCPKAECFESLSAMELAEQITLLDHIVFRSIPYESVLSLHPDRGLSGT